MNVFYKVKKQTRHNQDNSSHQITFFWKKKAYSKLTKDF